MSTVVASKKDSIQDFPISEWKIWHGGELGHNKGAWGTYLDLRGRQWQDAGENSIMKSFTICTNSMESSPVWEATTVQINKDEMAGGGCCIHGRDRRCIERSLGRPSADRILLKWFVSYDIFLSPFFLTTCFGHIRPSSGVYYFAKIVALHGMSKFSYHVYPRYLSI
jgi:hypothetical protein